MKRILEDIAPLDGNKLFVTHHWADKQTDPPLHFHDDYMLCLTLNVWGKRVMGDVVEDFSEKDLVIIYPGTPHCFSRDPACADRPCETSVVMFSRGMPDWDILATEQMEPIREMLLRPAAGIRFTEPLVDRVRERMLHLPENEGFDAVSLFFNILNDLATAPPDEIRLIGARSDDNYDDGRVQRILQFVENNYQRKLSLEEIGRLVKMSPTSVCRYFKRHTHQNLWEYLNSYRINRAAQIIAESNLTISQIGNSCGFSNISNFNHAFRERVGTTPGEYRRKFRASALSSEKVEKK